MIYSIDTGYICSRSLDIIDMLVWIVILILNDLPTINIVGLVVGVFDLLSGGSNVGRGFGYPDRSVPIDRQFGPSGNSECHDVIPTGLHLLNYLCACFLRNPNCLSGDR